MPKLIALDLMAPAELTLGGATPSALYAGFRNFRTRPYGRLRRDHASQIRAWPDGDHTLYNHAAGRNALTADWFAEQLLPTR